MHIALYRECTPPPMYTPTLPFPPPQLAIYILKTHFRYMLSLGWVLHCWKILHSKVLIVESPCKVVTIIDQEFFLVKFNSIPNHEIYWRYIIFDFMVSQFQEYTGEGWVNIVAVLGNFFSRKQDRKRVSSIICFVDLSYLSCIIY